MTQCKFTPDRNRLNMTAHSHLSRAAAVLGGEVSGHNCSQVLAGQFLKLEVNHPESGHLATDLKRDPPGIGKQQMNFVLQTKK